jgi:hypothetical protein
MKRILLMMLILASFVFLGVVKAQAQWTPIKRLTWNSGMSRCPALAVDSSGNLHVVWYDDTLGNNEIYYKKSTDGGSTWMASQRLTVNSGDSEVPAVSVDSYSHVHVVWGDNMPGNEEIYHKKSTNGGATWMTSQRLTWNLGVSRFPDIAADSSGNLHVVWYDNTPGFAEIYYRKSTNGGATWMTSRRLTWSSYGSYWPAIAVDAYGNVHVVWSSIISWNNEIYYKKSTNGGATWMTSRRLTWNSGYSYSPDMAVDSSGNVHVVWYDNTPGNYEIYYRMSTDKGSTWMTTQRLTRNSGASEFPAIAVDSYGSVHVAWYDNTPGANVGDIFYKKSTDGGLTWMTSKRLTWDPYGDSEMPAVALDSSGNVHVVWYDDTPGNYEIYYRKYVQ